MKKQQGYLYGTVVLAIGTLVVKLIGALFKIPLTNVLGGVGMSYFNVAYDLYYPLYALFVSGVPVAVSKLVSESAAKGRIQDANSLLRIALSMFTAIGLLGSLIMLLGTGWFTSVVQNPDAKYAVIMLAPSIFFGCITAALRGYWQGMQDMVPTAVSQIVEALTKLIFGLVISYYIVSLGMQEFAQSGTVFGAAYDSAEYAQLAVLPYAAAGAVLGVSISTLCGTIYMMLRHLFARKSLKAQETGERTPRRALARRLLALAVPVCVASVISNLTSFIDLISVMNRLNTAIQSAPSVLLARYPDMIPAGVELDKLASYLYGCYSGLAVPIYNLVPALAMTIGVSVLPAVSGAWAVGDREKLQRNVTSSLRMTAILSMPISAGICALSPQILNLLFFSRPMEAAVIAPALRLMGVGAMFVALTLPLNAMLQAVGRADLPVKLLLVGGAVKLALNYFLVAIPQINIQAAPVGTFACYAIVFFAGFFALVKETGIEIPLSALSRPLLAAVFCGIGAWASFGLLGRLLSESLATVIAIGIGGIIYVIMILFTKTLTKTELSMLPMGEKFAFLLEKYQLLG